MELIKITEQNGKKVVSARELHAFLEAKERFGAWFERQSQYGFVENIDLVGCKVFNTPLHFIDRCVVFDKLKFNYELKK